MMGVFEASVVLPRSRKEVFEYLLRPANLIKMIPLEPNDNLTMHVPEVIRLGGRLELNVTVIGNHFQFMHEITEVTVPERIVLQQIKGPFKSWIQEQHFADTAEGHTRMTSTIRFDPPGGILGFVVTEKFVLSQLEKWIADGYKLLQKDLSTASC
ncbi:MAG: hypothetical protein NTW75_06020 [Planctomycetales bacterium]|jgi:ligand-binding SRPBCC domain-containing protein|nr:hypothetical protein [Planctomycetales bacterium]